jgi:hypothetical protein
MKHEINPKPFGDAENPLPMGKCLSTSSHNH